MPSQTVYVITGASRGLGLALTQTYIARPYSTIICIVRNETSAAALRDALKNTIRGENSHEAIVHVDFSVPIAPETIRERISAAAGDLNYVNTVICAAGIVRSTSLSLETPAEEFRECFEVNTIAPLMVIQSLRDLLEKGQAATGLPPKYIVLTSAMGSIRAQGPFPGGAYGSSKAALNHIIKSLHQQTAESGLISVALHPGWVPTAMGDFVAKRWNYEGGPPDTLEDSVNGIVKVVDEATRDGVSGKFITYTGEEVPW